VPARARVRCGPREQRERERGDELEHFYHKSQQLGSAHSIFSKTPGAAAISSAKPPSIVLLACRRRSRNRICSIASIMGCRVDRPRDAVGGPAGLFQQSPERVCNGLSGGGRRIRTHGPATMDEPWRTAPRDVLAPDRSAKQTDASCGREADVIPTTEPVLGPLKCPDHGRIGAWRSPLRCADQRRRGASCSVTDGCTVGYCFE